MINLFIFAARSGDLAEVQRLVTEDPSLIELRDHLDETTLLKAAFMGRTAIVEWLIDYAGANIEAQDFLDGGAGLYFSSCFGHLEVVSNFLNRGADINRGDACSSLTSS